MRVAAVQMVASDGEADNLCQAATLIQAAAEGGARLVVLPEYFAYYGCDSLQFQQQVERESSPQGPARSFLAEQAQKHRIWLLGGTLPIVGAGDRRPFAASLLVEPNGEVVARYNKMHLFDVDIDEGSASSPRIYCESDRYRPGSDVVVADTPFARLGMSVCYDIRFPELYRQLARKGAEVLLVPSAFTASTGEAHWELLLRARAVENQCYVIGANMGDRQNRKMPTWGGSMIVDPWGRVLDRCDAGKGLAIAELDFLQLETLRKKMPVLEHIRL